MPLSKVISKARPNHPSLDFEVLRAEGIRHLEHFATELWSDYNAHDPGITILEVLCYAITDLGYRTRMIPVQDLMAMPGLRTSFGFLADEVLPGGPVTAMDYRKLMIDVKGVKNAWMSAGKSELDLFNTGIVFPALQDKDGNYVIELLNKITPDDVDTTIANLKRNGTIGDGDAAQKISNAITACLNKYFNRYENNPGSQKYINVVQTIGRSTTNKVAIKNIQYDWLKKLIPRNYITNNALDRIISVFEDKKQSDFPNSAYPDGTKNAFAAYPGITRIQGKTNWESFRLFTFDEKVKSLNYMVIGSKLDDFITSLNSLFSTAIDERKKSGLDNLLRTNYNYDLFAIAQREVSDFIEELGKLGIKFKGNTNDVKEKLNDYFKNQEKIISVSDKLRLTNILDEKGEVKPDLTTATTSLWDKIKEDFKLDDTSPKWDNIEKVGFELLKKTPIEDVDPDSVNSTNFTNFRNFAITHYDVFHEIKNEINAIVLKEKETFSHRVLFELLNSFFSEVKAFDHWAVEEILEGEDSPCKPLAEKLIEKFCELGMWGVSTSGTPLPLSGLHTILLDLDESIDPDIPNDVNPVLNRVKAVLHANRALCEDFVEFKIVEDRPIGICLQLDISPDADEIEIIAEAIRRMQLYLSPAPRFRTFTERIAELKATGENWSAEHIFNGPLLQNGFLVDVELGDNALREKYFHSDLLTEIKLAGKGILGVPVLKVKPLPELYDKTKTVQKPGADFTEDTEYAVRGGEYVGKDPLNIIIDYFKAVIDLDQSNFRVTKGALSYEVSNTKIAERLELLRLIHDTDPLEPRGGPVWEEGIFRPDLGDYNSIQYEFPSNYSIGDNRLPAHITSNRRAQTKQLQAYLAFYDQILAAYLQQLGRVRQLLSVDQTADLPTRVLPLLYDMPGIRDLIGEDAPFEATATDWAVALGRISDTMVSIPLINGEQNAQSDHKLVTEATVELRKKTQWEGIFELSDALAAALSKVHTHLHENYTATIENFFWAKYTDNPNNKYAQMLREMAESSADHQRRRNQLLDHLLARFGESFSTYAATLLRPESEPEDNPLLQDYDAYLSSKAKFLKEAAQLSYGRNKGYNYKSFNTLQNSSDVWNTENVSGVQRRVSRLLGIDNWSARSLIAEPDFRIDGFKTASKRGMANYFGALRKRIAAANSPENPDEAIPLLKIPNHKSPKEIQRIISDLYEIIWQARYYKLDEIIPDAVQYWFTIVSHKDDYKVVFLKRSDDPKVNLTLLESEVLSLDEAKLLIEVVIDLVKPKQQTKINEGFHIVEHILLRPLEADDALLKLSLGCEPTELPRDPYSFWITVVAPAETSRFSDPDFRKTFEYTLRSELPAHIAARFAYLDLKALYDFEEQFGRWMFEKAKCNPPNYCRVDEETKKLVEMLNNMPVKCPCDEQEVDFDCNKTLSSSISS